MAQYKEYPEVTIPAWLTDWEDASYHNNACPHSERELVRGKPYPLIQVWVNLPEEMREPELNWRYVVYRHDTEDEHTELSGTILYMGDSESEAQAATVKAIGGL